MFLISDFNQKDWFDYVVGTMSAIGSIATAGAFIYIFWQAKLARVQQFENNFFQLLNLHNKIASDLQKDSLLFVKAALDIKEIFFDAKDNGSGGSVPIAINMHNFEDVDTAFNDRYYKHYYRNYEDHFNHYFRNLYHVFKFIYQSDAINWKQKKNYAAIARAQLSQKELFILMFNSMYDDYGYPNFLFLIKKFKILDNFRHNEVEPHIVYDYFIKLRDEVEIPKGFKN